MQNHPLGKLFAQLTKSYIELAAERLVDLEIDRYYYCLYLLATNPNPMNQKELAAGLMVDKPAMVRIADYLEHKGSISRECNPRDRREQFLILTEKGKQQSEKIIEVYQQINRHFFEKLNRIHERDFVNELNNMCITLKGEYSREVIFQVKTKNHNK